MHMFVEIPPKMTVSSFMGYLRQRRTKTIYWILYASCLHLFRHIAQFVLARRQPCRVLVVQSDEKSDCAIHAQSLCGIALKGKSNVIFHERHGNLKFKYGNRSFWCRGYYVDTVGKNAKRIAEYIQNQLKEDQMTLREMKDPFTGSK